MEARVVTVERYESTLFAVGTVSRAGLCAHGGQDTCRQEPVFAVRSDHYNVAACDLYVAGALRQALSLERQ